MRWAQFITLYLAVGAPFGVSRGLRGPARKKSWHSLATALLWPVVAWRWLRRREWRQTFKTTKPAPDDHYAQKEREALLALAEFSCAMQPLAAAVTVEHLQQQTREALEKYVGLSRAVYELDADAAPGPRDVALFRLANHPDEECAARCRQRRNAIRLQAHHTQARQEFLRILYTARQTAAGVWGATSGPSAIYARNHWNGFVDCVQQLCESLGDAATAEATRRLAAEDFRPATPANTLPPQEEVTICTPMLNLPLEHLPDRTTRLS